MEHPLIFFFLVTVGSSVGVCTVTADFSKPVSSDILVCCLRRKACIVTATEHHMVEPTDREEARQVGIEEGRPTANITQTIEDRRQADRQWERESMLCV